MRLLHAKILCQADEKLNSIFLLATYFFNFICGKLNFSHFYSNTVFQLYTYNVYFYETVVSTQTKLFGKETKITIDRDPNRPEALKKPKTNLDLLTSEKVRESS